MKWRILQSFIFHALFLSLPTKWCNSKSSQLKEKSLLDAVYDCLHFCKIKYTKGLDSLNYVSNSIYIFKCMLKSMIKWSVEDRLDLKVDVLAFMCILYLVRTYHVPLVMFFLSEVCSLMKEPWQPISAHQFAKEQVVLWRGLILEGYLCMKSFAC